MICRSKEGVNGAMTSPNPNIESFDRLKNEGFWSFFLSICICIPFCIFFPIPPRPQNMFDPFQNSILYPPMIHSTFGRWIFLSVKQCYLPKSHWSSNCIRFLISIREGQIHMGAIAPTPLGPPIRDTLKTGKIWPIEGPPPRDTLKTGEISDPSGGPHPEIH